MAQVITTREELLGNSKPILFNTEMVRALLDGRKTVTRRVIKPQPTRPRWNNIGWLGFDDGHGYKMRQPCDVGDILYVRETWQIQSAHRYEADAKIYFKADGEMTRICFANGCTDDPNRDEYDNFIKKWYRSDGKWRPSIHMPKAAARLFLRVTDIRVERLKAINQMEVFNEGFDNLSHFIITWEGTIKKSDLDKYGWDANPWVWVIEFERL